MTLITIRRRTPLAAPALSRPVPIGHVALVLVALLSAGGARCLAARRGRPHPARGAWRAVAARAAAGCVPGQSGCSHSPLPRVALRPTGRPPRVGRVLGARRPLAAAHPHLGTTAARSGRGLGYSHGLGLA